MFKSLTYLFIVGMLCGISLSLSGQQYLTPSPVVAQMLGVNQGLSQGMINCIYQDREGYIWICTKDGLNRYDGYQIYTYRHNPNVNYSLPDNYCNAIAEDDKGNFWVATNTRGLYLFDKRAENFYPVPIVNNKKENLCVRAMEYDRRKLFLKTLTNALLIDVAQVSLKNNPTTVADVTLLFSYNQAQPNKKYQVENNSVSRYLFSRMPGNDIWVSFSDSLFHFIPNANFSAWTATSISPSNLGFEKAGNSLQVFFPIPGEPENMLIACENKLIHFNANNKKIIFTKNLDRPNEATIRDYFYTNDSNICRITSSHVTIYHPKSREVEVVNVKNLSLPERSIYQLYTDGQNMRWYGSSGFGIAKIDPRQQLFKSYKGTHPAEVFLETACEHNATGIASAQGIWRMVLDNTGTYWAYSINHTSAYPSQLYSYNSLTGKTIIHHTLPKNCFAYNIYGDVTDGLWVYYQDSTRKNFIARVDKAKGSLITPYPIPENIESPEPFVSQFYYDKDEIMWLATIDGLYAFNEKNNSWKHWKNVPDNSNSISANGVLSICADPIAPDKYLWIGTEGAGMNRFEKSTGNCVRYDEKDGLPNNVAYCILSDSLNNLWISTNKGLCCFNTAQKTFRNFTKEDGLPGNEFNRYDAMRMQNGELMFGGVDGFVIFNPREILQKQPAASLVFTGVSILNKPVDWKTDSNNINAPVGYTNTLTLLPDQNIFSISFATLEYRSNAKKMYRYKLEGFDKDWTSPGSRNEVTYTNLSPGTYTLYVMGANTDGVWNEKPISMKIVVKPYWYQTLLFKLTLVFLLAFALYALYRFRLRHVLKLEKLRNRIARDLHDEIGSTLSSISFYAESAKKVTAENQKANTILSKINEGTSEMMEAMSDIVWAVNTGSDDFDNLANRLRSYAVQVTEAKNIGLYFTDNKDIPRIALDMEQQKNSYLICKEAINNTVKYANCSLLEVLISKEQQRLCIHIRDNGKGFVLENPQTFPAGFVSGGNGLKNMKSRADEINAGLEIRTAPGSGTSIILSIPLKKS